ncbi:MULTISPECIES: type II toxin-antitoxin system PemK/MazF family toxin [Sorangium]|uniref:type II toxin-antitoxin system PemK/MazF family toxin n=1 Tax=Sorangium TaxID=39643 RepID=UPI003D9BFEC3
MRSSGFDHRGVAARARGLAPPAISAKLRPGAVCHVDNSLVVFPEGRLPRAGEPAQHEKRWVIVVQSMRLSTSADPKTILVVPCSASHRGDAGPWDYELPPGEEGFTRPRVVALASLVQPFLKGEMLTHIGQLKQRTLIELQRVVLRNFGVLQESAFDLQLPGTSGQDAGPVSADGSTAGQ